MTRHTIFVLIALVLGCSGPSKGSTDPNGDPNNATDMAAADSANSVQNIGQCGGCAPPEDCGAPPEPCSCGCAEGDLFAGKVCTAEGCLVPLPADMGIFDAGDSGSDAMSVDLGTDVGVDMPPPRQRGDCMSDADCNGTSCLSVPDVRGGYRVCEKAFQEPTSCQQNPDLFPMDECCKHDECTDRAGANCVSNTLFFCGGALPPPQNVCRYDACSSDADCTDTANRLGDVGTCVPAGAFGEPAAICSYGTCQVDADCTERAGGECTAFFAPCAGRFTGFFCTYDDSTCRTDADCPPPMQQFGTPKCIPGGDSDETQCIEWLPPI